MTPFNIRVFVWKEEDMYIAKSVDFNIASQGKTVREALGNVKEALELYFEDPDVQKIFPKSIIPFEIIVHIPTQEEFQNKWTS